MNELILYSLLQARNDLVRNRPLSTSSSHQAKATFNGHLCHNHLPALEVSIKSSNTQTLLHEHNKPTFLEVQGIPRRSRTCENCSKCNYSPSHLFSDRLRLSDLVSTTPTKDPPLYSNLTKSHLLRNSSWGDDNLALPAKDGISLSYSDCKLSEKALTASNNFIKESKSQAEWRKRFATVRRIYYQKSAALIFFGLCIFAMGMVFSVLYFPTHSHGVLVFGPVLLAAGLLTIVCGLVWIPIITRRMARKKQVLTRTFSM